MEVTSEPNWGVTSESDGQKIEASAGGNPWPCMFMMLVACLTVLGICWGGVYWLTNLPQ